MADIMQILDEMFKEKTSALLSELGEDYENFITGSRYICEPPVMNTDLDVVFLVDENREKAYDILRKHKVHKVDFSEDEYDGIDENFSAFRLHDLNIIICRSYKFYERFKIATEIAKSFNLLKKEDRIVLFQAIIYQKYSGEEF